MQSNKVLFGVILILSISSVLALGFLAWVLSDLSRAGSTSAAVEAALASARDSESSSDASPLPPPLELSPEPFRGFPTSLAEFQMIPATLTPEPVPTKIYGDPALVLGEYTWTDAFESPSSSAEGGSVCASGEVDQGRLRLTTSGPRGEFCPVLVQTDSPDFYLRVDLEPLGQCSSGEFGLFFRGTEDGQGSYLAQTCDGRSRLIFRTAAGGSLLLSEGASSLDRQLPGLANQIGILARGDRITIYANGTLLAELQDPLYPDGEYFGLFLRSQGDSSISVGFDNLTFWDLSE